MHVVLEVQTDGRRFELRPGDAPLTVGRRNASIAIPEDPYLSNTHFTLFWEGDECRIRDSSRNGTRLNGRSIQEATLENGDQIHAGTTAFFVHVIEPVSTGSIDDLAGFLRQTTPCFALLDAAKENRLLELLTASGDRYRSLYDGLSGIDIQRFAPYLVQLQPESRLTNILTEEGWGQSWGVYLYSPDDFTAIWLHFQQWIFATLPNRRKVFFRFYDPRVLRVFLPTCNEQELELFFGPVKRFVLESDSPDQSVEFTLQDKQLRTKEYRIATLAAQK